MINLDLLYQKEEPLILDPSKRGAIQECARRYAFEFKLGITPRRTPDYFLSGRAWDDALGEWNKGRDGDAARRAIKAIYEVYQEEDLEYINPKRTPENVASLFERYLDYFKEEPFKIIRSNIGFLLPFPGEDFLLGGEIDQYAEWPNLGVVVHENKTTTIIPQRSAAYDRYLAGFSLGQYADQLLHYYWAVSQVTEKPWGVCITIACLDIPKRASTKRQLFDRKLFPINEQQVEDYLDSLRMAAWKVHRCEKLQRWPREGKHCTGGWGFQACAYQHLCRTNIPLEKLEIPSNLYKEGRQWAPWEGIKRDKAIE